MKTNKEIWEAACSAIRDKIAQIVLDDEGEDGFLNDPGQVIFDIENMDYPKIPEELK